jgi:hypothetical protein
MKKRLHLLVILSLGLAALLLTLSTASTSYATTHIPHSALSGGPCPADQIQNTGISYDADTYTTSHTDNPTNQPAMGMFGSAATWGTPSIGAWTCGDSGWPAIDVSDVGADWYNMIVTINGVSTQTTATPPNIFNLGDHEQIPIPIQLPEHGQSTIQVQSCNHILYWDVCGNWSPHLQMTIVTNSACQDGYVWREVTAFDHVCVTPEQHDQVASDNSQAGSHINSDGSCISGYIWRAAFGGDHICVTPDERDQVASDNKQELSRVAAP